MGKFNKKSINLDLENDMSDNNSIDWQHLLVDFQNKSVDETIKNIMEKFMTKENIEFDQICLILKHYLLLENENKDIDSNSNQQDFFNHMLTFNQQFYINQLIERFNNFNQQPNSQWMISEIIKLISSSCSNEQAGILMTSPQFSSFLLNSVFDSNILAKLKLRQSGFSLTEAAILTNIFETISNLCEVKSDLKNYVTKIHIEWLADALIGINKVHTDLTVAIARLLHLISDHSSTQTNELLLDLYLNKNFFLNCLDYLSKMDENNNLEITLDNRFFNLNAKLYLIGSLVNIIIFCEKSDIELNFRKSDYLIKLLREYRFLIQHSLGANLNENKTKNKRVNSENLTENGSIETEQNDNNNLNQDQSEEDAKTAIKSLEYSIESKMLSIELLASIFNFFIKDDGSQADDEDYESWEECEDEMDNDEMDVEMKNDNIQKEEKITDELTNITDIKELKQIINDMKLMSLLIKTVSQDDENIFQETDRIDHIYNSVKFIRNESLKTYILLIENFYLNKAKSDDVIEIDIENLFVLLNLLSKKSYEDLEFLLAGCNGASKKNESIIKFVEIIYDLFEYFNDPKRNVLSLEHKFTIINLIKDVLLKFKVEIVDLCVRLARIVCLLAINERNTNFADGKELIQISATILIELAIGSFELGDQNKLESLRLNAELLDLIIDLFSEDNMIELEKNLNFVEKIKWFSDKFYSKYKILGKKQKIEKDHSLILKTVKDNFKSFVDYKIKNSK